MPKVDEIHAELKQGRPPSEVYKEFGRSSGPFFEALSRVTGEKLKEFDGVRAELAHVTTELGAATLKLQTTEQLRTSYGRQVHELRDLLKRMRVDETQAGVALEEFRKTGLKPAEALELLKQEKDLNAAIGWAQAKLQALERKNVDIDNRVELTKESLAGWSRRLEAERSKATFALAAGSRALEAQRRDIATANQQRCFLNMEVDRLSKELAALEPRVSNSIDEAKALGDRIRAMRLARPKIQFLHDNLTSEVRTLEHRRSELVQIILVASEKIRHVLELEEKRGARVDVAHATKRRALDEEIKQLRQDAMTKLGEELRRVASERVENLPVLEGQAAELSIQLQALGTTIEERAAQLEGLEKSIDAVNNGRGFVVGLG